MSSKPVFAFAFPLLAVILLSFAFAPLAQRAGARELSAFQLAALRSVALNDQQYVYENYAEETVLHQFRETSDGYFDNGFIVETPLIQGSDGNFYGTTSYGGYHSDDWPNGGGVAFKIDASGDFTVLHKFGDESLGYDGCQPESGMTEGPDGNFYGTTYRAPGAAYAGTVYRMTPAGVVTILHKFRDGTVADDGQNPQGGLILGRDGNFYGMTAYGGSTSSGAFMSGSGTIFKMTPSGTVTILHSFRDGSTTNDGADPLGGLLQASDGNFYGLTSEGGSTTYPGWSGSGSAFRMTPSGTVTVLHSFGDGSVKYDGVYPQASLIQATDGNLYGTTWGGGSIHCGAIFRMTLSGTITIVHSFNPFKNPGDGEIPRSTLIQASDGYLYGTAPYGGWTVANGWNPQGLGMVFRVSLTGDYKSLYSFRDGANPADGSEPMAGLIQASDGDLYGTTSGVYAGIGTVYKIGLPRTRFEMIADGHDSLLWQNSSTGQLVEWATNGTDFKASTGVFAHAPAPWQVKAVADVNGAGHPDLLWWNADTGQMLFWGMSGKQNTTIRAAGHVIGTAPTVWQPVSMADFNGDGHPDILFENMDTGGLVIWYMDGQDHISTSRVFGAVPAGWRVAGTADFNGDGHPDILWRNTTTGQVVIWYMGGDSGTTMVRSSGVIATVPPTWQVASTGDMNGDGHPDITWHNSKTGQVVVWLMGGADGATIEQAGKALPFAPPTSWSIVGVH